ncbi:NAD-dependent epimerase/dehydratase family protein [Verrucomicrobiales bacterium BCK34]|nr:NAD-dependent epimerase/dehydratase family protein [Verrucomicrobiales bacterium BCK34]
MAKPTILIIGHGYVGSELARQLDEEGYLVTAVNRTLDDTPAPFPLVEADVSSLDSLDSLQSAVDWPDWIIHCASSGRGGADAYRSVFIDGVKNIQDVFTETPIILTSSSSVYGQVDGSVVDENSETSPDRETSQILCEAEALVTGQGGIALRLAGIYGPDRSVHLKKMLNGTATIESGEVSRYLNQIHRDDAAGAIRHLIECEGTAHCGRVFNVNDDTPITMRDCYEKMAAFFELPVPPESEPDRNRKRAWTNKIVSNAALKATGWNPTYPSFIDALSGDPRLVPSIREQIAQG